MRVKRTAKQSRRFSSSLFFAVFGVLAVAALSVVGRAQQPAVSARPSELHILPLRGNVFLLHGAGANITLSIGKEGVLLVDSGSAVMADNVVATVTELVRQVAASPVPVKPCVGLGCAGAAYPSYLATIASPGPPPPIRFIVNTNADPDHTGGNAKVAQSGTTLGGGPGVGQFQAIVKSSAVIYAHENVLRQLAAAKVPAEALPTEAYTDDFKLYLNGEGIQLIHLDAAHGNGDTIVHFRGSDVISTGDVFSTTSYPVVDVEHGGSIDGIIGGLNRLLDLVIPEYQSEGGTLLVPGHGRVSDIADLATYRDSVTIMRDRVRKMITMGMTLEQIQAARPTKDYDTRYNTAEWPKDKFVEAVYKSLTASKR
jgi:cyclase